MQPGKPENSIINPTINTMVLSLHILHLVYSVIGFSAIPGMSRTPDSISPTVKPGTL
jgi:hypothetical protein